MSAIDCPRFWSDEPPLRKQKLETSRCSASAVSAKSLQVSDDEYLSEDDELASDEEAEYDRQVLESDGFDVEYFPHPHGGIHPHVLRDKNEYNVNLGLYTRLGLHCYNLDKGTNLQLLGIQKFNTEMCVPFGYYITSEAADTSNNTPCIFQTCIREYRTPVEGYFMVQTEISRLKVPNGPRDTPMWLETQWEDKAIDNFYKGKMPNWLTKAELAAASDKGCYYELQESDMLQNDWLHLFAEFAFHVRWRGLKTTPFLPLKIKKVIVQTLESGEDPPHLKLKANNAIFYMSFKGNGDPSGKSVEYQAMVRKTRDGKPGHIGLEVQCWAYISN